MLSRRTFMKLFVAGAVAMSASTLAGCASSSDALWTATYDESLGLLATGPNEDVVMGNAWIPKDDGTVQLQFAAGSIPVPAVESARMQGSNLCVTMASSDGPATMDLRLHQFVLTPPRGIDGSSVESVTLVIDGEEYPAERAEISIG